MADEYIVKIPTEKCLELMVQEEERIRISKEYQEECTKVKNTVNGWLDVSAAVQKQVAKQFGFVDDINNNIAVNMIRRARYLYPDNNIFKTVPIYVRENKANIGNYKVNDSVKNITLINDNTEQVNFNELLYSDRLNLIISSSIS